MSIRCGTRKDHNKIVTDAPQRCPVCKNPAHVKTVWYCMG